MGASLTYRIFPYTESSEDIKKKWALMVQSSLAEHGNSYSGDIGMLGPNLNNWVDKKFDTQEQAEDYMGENHSKHHSAMAVSFYGTEKATEAQIAKAAELITEVKQLSMDYGKIIKDEMSEILKDEFCTCKACKSRLATKHFGNFQATTLDGGLCPLCKASLFGVRVNNALTKIEEKSQEKHQKAQELRRGKKSSKLYWMIGGLCSC